MGAEKQCHPPVVLARRISFGLGILGTATAPADHPLENAHFTRVAASPICTRARVREVAAARHLSESLSDREVISS